MFTLIKNYRAMISMLVVSHAQIEGADTSGAIPDTIDLPLTPEAELVAREGLDEQGAVKDVTREELENLTAVTDELRDGKNINSNSPDAAIKDIQEIFIHLGIDLGTYGPKGNGVDGDYGNTMVRVVRAFQTEKGLPVTGEVDVATYDALLAASSLAGSLSEEIQERAEAERTAAREVVRSFDVEADITNREAVIKLQEALNTLGYALRGSNNGVDGIWTSTGSTSTAYNEEIAKIRENTINTNVVSAQTELEASQAEISEANERIEDARVRLVEQQGELETAGDLVSQQIKEIEAAGIELGNSQLQLEASQAEILRIQAEITETQQMQDTQIADWTALMDRMGDGISVSQREQSELEAIQTELLNIENAITGLQTSLESAVIQSEAELAERETARIALEEARTAATEARTAATEARTAFNNSRNPFYTRGYRLAAEAAEASAEEAEALLATAEVNFNKESGEATGILEAIRMLETQIVSQRNVFEAAQAEAERAEGEFEAAQNELQQITADIEAFDTTYYAPRIEALQAALIRSISSVDRSATSISEIRTSIAELEAELDRRNAIFESESQDVRRVVGEIDDASVVIEAATSKAAETQTQLETALQAQYEMLRESALLVDTYMRLEIQGELTAESVRQALANDSEGKQLLCLLQADLKLLKDADGNSLYSGSIDGSFGPGTTRAVEAAIAQYGSLLAIGRTARMEEVRVEAETNNSDGRTNAGLDLVAQTEGYEQGMLEAFLSEYRVTADMPDDLKIQPGMNEADREALLFRQRAWVIDQAIAMGDRENADRTRITFIDGLSDYGNDNLKEVMTELRRNFETAEGREELRGAMMNGADVLTADFTHESGIITLGGKNIRTDLLESAYIATGSELTTDIDGTRQRGTMEVPIWLPDGSINPKFAELDFANATYINGAIVMTMKNGCEGNLVIIPVNREKYVPPVRPPRTVTTPPRTTPRDPETPEEPEIPVDEPNVTCTTDKVCRGNYYYTRTRCYDTETWAPISATDWIRTSETCRDRPDRDDSGATTRPVDTGDVTIDPGDTGVETGTDTGVNTGGPTGGSGGDRPGNNSTGGLLG